MDKLQEAIRKCHDKNNQMSNYKKLYAFTTENIAGYIDKFNLKDKSLLTVGSSLDQAISANLKGSNNVTVMEDAPLTKEYFYLKKAAIKLLSREEFLKYFCRVDNAGETFNIETFYKIKDYLAFLDKDSFIFWNELYKRFSGPLIRDKLFKKDEEKKDVLLRITSYLKNEQTYLEEKKKIEDFTPTIINKSIKEEINQEFDNIFLSLTALRTHSKEMVETYQQKIMQNLSINGKILIRYVFFALEGKLDIEKFFYSYFDKDYIYDIIEELIPSIEENKNDGVLIYQKRK